jgi:uncharacterized protein YjbI with pentapeptide repeats
MLQKNRRLITGSIVLLASIGMYFLWKAQQKNVDSIQTDIANIQWEIINKKSPLKELELRKDILAIKKDATTIQNGIYTNLIQAFGGLFVVVTAYLGYENFKIGKRTLGIAGDRLDLDRAASQQTLKISEDKQTTERFSNAIEHLGHETVDIRLGGIYALEQIAINSPKYHWIIIEILSAFIREKSTLNKPDISGIIPVQELRVDVKACVTVICRRTINQDESKIIDLRRVYLENIEIDKKANLHKADLREANLHKADLSEADLSEAILNGTNLGEANLNEAILYKAKLNKAILNKAILNKAILNKAKLKEANLREAILHGANLSEATLNGASLIQAELHKATLCKAILDYASLDGATLSGAKLIEVHLSGATLNGAIMHETNLIRANLTGADLRGADLRGADLRGADLRGADLTGAKLIKVNLRGADLRKADLTGVDLCEADLCGADLREAKNFTSTQIKLACFWQQAKYDSGKLEKLQQDTASDPQKPIDCSHWQPKK